MKKDEAAAVFLTLGLIWVIVGFIIYQNSAIWPIGFIFLIIGLILKVSKDNVFFKK